VSVLSREEIIQRLHSGDLIVTPLLPPVTIDAGTIDIRLGRHFITFRKSRYRGTDVLETFREAGAEVTRSAKSDRLSIEVGRTVERVTVDLGESFVLHPGQLVLACTLEYIGLPANVGAQVLSRSTTGRLGILSATATFFHPGFRGVPTLELVNTSETAVSVTPGLRIAQLLLEEAHETPYEPGRYQMTTRPQIARLSRDAELEALSTLRPEVDS
jgi:dCTP deaminase